MKLVNAEEVRQIFDYEVAQGATDLFDAFDSAVENATAVDAAPVVHGRCEYCKDGKSFIGARMLLGNDGKWHDINNCPNCGAKMDGGTES